MDKGGADDLSLAPETGMLEFMRASAQSNLSLFDQKAGAMLAFNVAMVLYLLQSLACAEKNACFSSSTLVADCWACLGVLVGVAASISSLLVLRPKTDTNWKDAVFWGSAVFRMSMEEFFREMSSMSPHQASEVKMRHVYVLAQICRKKARRLKWASWLTSFALVCLVGAK